MKRDLSFPATHLTRLEEEEVRLLERTRAMTDALEDVADGIRSLARAYRRGYREQRRMLRISDRLQLDLHQANQALDAENRARCELESQLRKVAMIDELTGLYNRRQILLSASLLQNRWRETGKPLSVIVLDLDYFKDINDTYGHAMGDQVLRRFASFCQEAVRDTDVVGRLGGEEFLVLLPGTPLEPATHIAQRLCEELGAQPIRIGDVSISLTVSAGVAQIATAEEAIETTIHRADVALYRAKEAGRNRVEQAVWPEPE